MLLILLALGCSNNEPLDQDQTANRQVQAEGLEDQMKALYDEILMLIEDKSCNGGSTCKTIAIGAKACGGPVDYLVYSSTHVNEALLIKKLKEYKSLNIQYNKLNGIFSDCMFETPPSVECKDAQCVEVVY